MPGAQCPLRYSGNCPHRVHGRTAVVEQTAGASAEMISRNADALIVVLGTPLFTQQRAEIVELAGRQRLPRALRHQLVHRDWRRR
jgi:hypothetical protein